MRKTLSLAAVLTGVLALTAVAAILVLSRGPEENGSEMKSYYMPARSMEPLLEAGEHFQAVVVDDYEPRRGDVIVFQDPGGWLAPDSDDGLLVKRVIGLPGDTIVCCDEEGRLLVNGEPLDESSYIEMSAIECAGPMTGTCRWRSGPVADDGLFVMGDNRSASADSTLHLCTEAVDECDPNRAYVPIDLVRAVVKR